MVSAEVTSLYSDTHPGMIVIQHDLGGGYHRVVGALCENTERSVEIEVTYSLIGCAEPHGARAWSVSLIDAYNCEDDFSENAPRLDAGRVPLANAAGDWVEVFAGHTDKDGCDATPGTGAFSLVLGL